MVANHKPTVKGQDEGIWRRIRLIPFEVTIPPEDQDPDLITKLKGELPGILTWDVHGCLEYQKDGLQEPEAVRAATDGYRAESDVFGAFLEEETETSHSLSVEAGVLYARYKDWCERTGERPKTQTMFGRYLGERGLERSNDPSTRRRIYLGIGRALFRGLS